MQFRARKTLQDLYVKCIFSPHSLARLIAVEEFLFCEQSGAIFVSSIWQSVRSTSHVQVVAFTLLMGAMVGVMESGGGIRESGSSVVIRCHRSAKPWRQY